LERVRKNDCLFGKKLPVFNSNLKRNGIGISAGESAK
jgi:hypothetical protein